MKPFNLAESKIAERNYCKQQLQKFLRIMAVLVVAVIVAVAASSACKVAVKHRSRQVSDRLADVQKRCTEIKNEMSEVNVNLAHRDWQHSLVATSRERVGLLDALLERVPADTWLNRVEVSDKSSALLVDGSTASFDSLSGFVGRLRRAREFKLVRLTGSRVMSSGCVAFSIEVSTKEVDADGAVQASDKVPDIKASL